MMAMLLCVLFALVKQLLTGPIPRRAARAKADLETLVARMALSSAITVARNSIFGVIAMLPVLMPTEHSAWPRETSLQPLQPQKPQQQQQQQRQQSFVPTSPLVAASSPRVFQEDQPS